MAEDAELEALMNELNGTPAAVPPTAPAVAVKTAEEPTPEPVREITVKVSVDTSEAEAKLEAARKRLKQLQAEEEAREAKEKEVANAAVEPASVNPEDHRKAVAEPEAKPVRTLNYIVDTKQFRNDTNVTEATIDKCMMEQASLRAYYSTMAAGAEAQASRAKARFEVIEASIYDAHRKAALVSGEKYSEKSLEASVKMDPKWIKAKSVVIEAESIAAINKGLVFAMNDKKDMLVQMGADRREGMKGAVRTMEKENIAGMAAVIGKQALKSYQ